MNNNKGIGGLEREAAKTRVKICGITNRKDAFLAADLGACALGFVFFRGSKRFISHDDAREIVSALPPFVVKVGVFVEEPPQAVLKLKQYCGLDRVQVYDARRCAAAGHIEPGHIIAAHRVGTREDVERAKTLPFFPLFDNAGTGVWGGSGKRFDWTILEDFDGPYILAGGIGPDNVDDALGFHPYAIDIASGVEIRPGKKDPEKMRALFKRLEMRRS